MHFCSESSKAESTSQQNSLKSITKEREETFKKAFRKAFSLLKVMGEKCADFAVWKSEKMSFEKCKLLLRILLYTLTKKISRKLLTKLFGFRKYIR